MAVNLNALAEVQTVGSNQNMLLFGDNNVATRIDYDKLAEAILDRLTSKTYSGINNNVISAIRANASDIAVLDGRMDEFTKLPEGSTTGDAELIDGRTGYDGTTYTSIGTAIRSQISDLHDSIGDNISASNVGYNGSASGLVATNVQAAIDEVVSTMDTPSGDTVPAEVKNAIYILLNKAAYIETGLSDELAIVEDWASASTTLAIRNRLTGCTTNNSATTIERGSRYSAVLTVNSGYTFNTVKVTMGGVDITSTVYSSGTITIPSVTGDIVITATAVSAVASLSAVYTQSGTVYETTALSDLTADLVVTATYSDSSTATIPSTDYTLSGTLEVGTSTITVSYAGKTTTFNVVVSEIYEYSMSNGLLVKVVGGTITDTNASQDIVWQSSNTNRRTFYVENGTKPVVNRDASYAETDYYPIPIPASATQVTVSITPSTQFHGEGFWTYINGVYTRTYDAGWKQGSFTHTFEAGTYDFLTITSKYDSAGTSYPTEPTDLVVEFE